MSTSLLGQARFLVRPTINTLFAKSLHHQWIALQKLSHVPFGISIPMASRWATDLNWHFILMTATSRRKRTHRPTYSMTTVIRATVWPKKTTRVLLSVYQLLQQWEVHRYMYIHWVGMTYMLRGYQSIYGRPAAPEMGATYQQLVYALKAWCLRLLQTIHVYWADGVLDQWAVCDPGA